MNPNQEAYEKTQRALRIYEKVLPEQTREEIDTAILEIGITTLKDPKYHPLNKYDERLFQQVPESIRDQDELMNWIGFAIHAKLTHLNITAANLEFLSRAPLESGLIPFHNLYNTYYVQVREKGGLHIYQINLPKKANPQDLNIIPVNSMSWENDLEKMLRKIDPKLEMMPYGNGTLHTEREDVEETLRTIISEAVARF